MEKEQLFFKRIIYPDLISFSTELIFSTLIRCKSKTKLFGTGRQCVGYFKIFSGWSPWFLFFSRYTKMFLDATCIQLQFSSPHKMDGILITFYLSLVPTLVASLLFWIQLFGKSIMYLTIPFFEWRLVQLHIWVDFFHCRCPSPPSS